MTTCMMSSLLVHLYHTNHSLLDTGNPACWCRFPHWLCCPALTLSSKDFTWKLTLYCKMANWSSKELCEQYQWTCIQIKWYLACTCDVKPDSWIINESIDRMDNLPNGDKLIIGQHNDRESALKSLPTWNCSVYSSTNYHKHTSIVLKHVFF